MVDTKINDVLLVQENNTSHKLYFNFKYNLDD